MNKISLRDINSTQTGQSSTTVNTSNGGPEDRNSATDNIAVDTLNINKIFQCDICGDKVSSGLDAGVCICD